MPENSYRYGQHSGQKSGQQPQLPFAQPSMTPSQTPYQAAYQQSNAPTGNYAALHNSFQYNSNNIPGLGLSDSFAPAPYHAERNVAWNVPPQNVQQHNSTEAQKAITTTSNETSSHTNVLEQRPVTTPQVPQDNTLEEGELSEGEFDDLYEPKESTDATGPTPKLLKGLEHRNGSVGDADGSSIYDGPTPQGEAITNIASTSLHVAEREYSPGRDWEATNRERERSGSYSPYLSPREIRREVSVSKPTSHETKQAQVAQTTISSLPGIAMTSNQQSRSTAPLSNGTHHTNPVGNGSIVGVGPSVPTKDSKSPTTFHSVAEAKKKAQEAILGLWPLKVRYQDYIEEGVDEKMVKGLFTELGLETPVPKPTPANKAVDSVQVPTSSASNPTKVLSDIQNRKDQPSTAANPKQSTATETTASASKMDEPKTAVKSAAEERKDKIARKLAAKAQKPAVAVQPSVQAPPSQPTQAQPAKAQTTQAQPAQGNLSMTTPAITSPAKTKTRAENNALLHQKLAALKKAQEERAIADKKLATETATKPATPLAVPISGLVTSSKGPVNVSTTSPAVSKPFIEAIRRSASVENAKTKEGGIPGLSLSTQPAPTINRNLKRPVASDFDNYPIAGGTLKRTRTQDTLIIDVSDDEDVEMDMGSPTEELNSANEINNPPHRSLGSFPPLPDSLNWKQRSSPSSSAVTPKSPNGAKLDLLTKRIEEARRKIAEAEAKKVATKPNTTQSPEAQVLAEAAISPLKDLKVSKVRDEARKANAQRRERIVSYELVNVETTLKEKQDMLKEAVARAAQLELEIQASIAERDKLSTEVEELSKSPKLLEAQPTFLAEPEASFSTNHTIDSHISTEQEPSSDQDSDVSMDETEDEEDEDQGAVLNEARHDSHSAQPDSLASRESPAIAATTSQPQQDHVPVNEELQVDTSIGNAASEDNSPDSTGENNGNDSGAIAASSTVTFTGLEQPKVNGLESLPQGDIASSNEPYRPEIVSAPSTHNTPFSGQENGVIVPILRQDESVSLVDESPARQILTEAGPSQTVQELVSSAPTDPSGQVQNSSSHEHPSLTEKQDGPKETPQVGDPLSYHSPLAYFRAYRFHPRYFDEVAGGLKSMTYSSKIDPMRPLCPYVLSGEQCPNGSACEFQHFDTMVLPDAEIITQLGSADMFTGETRNRFIEGLKKVLNELKANKVRDFDNITKAIVKHRQEFLEDKSKVLPLDTSTN